MHSTEHQVLDLGDLPEVSVSNFPPHVSAESTPQPIPTSTQPIGRSPKRKKGLIIFLIILVLLLISALGYVLYMNIKKNITSC